MKGKILEGKRLECFALFIFVAAYLTISAFHEPWFDEAEAWQIAKCASLKELLFVLPHYEGHPPLWHLLLAIPAKLGVPFELGLKGLGLVFSTASAALMLFRSRLPRLARLLLPFSYFFFYQYGIIVRPYCLTLLVMLLLGMVYADRNEHPWRVTGLLVLLCLSCAYGIVLAGGIAVCMVLDLWREKGFSGLLRGLLKDRRTQALLLLLFCALLLILEILPREDTYSPLVVDGNSFLLCLVCILFVFPGECFYTTGSWFSADRSLLQEASISIPEMVLFCVIGVFFWIILICVSSKKNLKLLLIPYVLFAVFAASVYYTAHHLGMIFAFFLFWFEVQFREEDRFEIGRIIAARIAKTEHDKTLLHGLQIGLGCLCLAVPIYWTAAASYHDVISEYSFGKSAAAFLKENGLEDRLILVTWDIQGSLYPQSEGHEDYVNPYMAGTGAELSAYFKQNMALNLNNGDDRMAYNFHKLASYEDSQRAKAQWAAKGSPELIIGKPELELVYGDTLSYSDYSLVKVIYTNYIWKNGRTYSAEPILIRNDLLSQHELEPITGAEALAFFGMTVTDEMREQYENGVPVEEILKPYLDALFGEA